MSRVPCVSMIFVCPEKGKPMVRVPEVYAVKGRGLEGDRYFMGTGTYTGGRHDYRHVTLIHVDQINEANKLLSVPFPPEETRRNLVVVGSIDLSSLIGHEFRVGEVRLHGFEECTPCRVPERQYMKEGFFNAFQGRGGLRAVLLSSGTIYERDNLTQVKRR